VSPITLLDTQEDEKRQQELSLLHVMSLAVSTILPSCPQNGLMPNSLCNGLRWSLRGGCGKALGSGDRGGEFGVRLRSGLQRGEQRAPEA